MAETKVLSTVTDAKPVALYADAGGTTYISTKLFWSDHTDLT